MNSGSKGVRVRIFIVPVLSMRWWSAGKMPVLAIMSRELQKIAAMLATYERGWIVEIERERERN